MKNIFAQRLKELMVRTKTTQVELAKKLGITRQSVSQYLNGDVIPNVEKLYLIADFFDVSSDYLIGRLYGRLFFYKKTAKIKKGMDIYIKLCYNIDIATNKK